MSRERPAMDAWHTAILEARQMTLMGRYAMPRDLRPTFKSLARWKFEKARHIRLGTWLV
jgi:hypothetical protein